MRAFTTTIRWAARLTSLLSVAILLLFVGSDFDVAAVGARQAVGLLFFPLTVIVGLLLGLWKEGLGGAVAVAGTTAFYLVYGLLLGGRIGGPWFFLFTSPALLMLVAWTLSRMDHGPHRTTPADGVPTA